ncbi:MAG: extracellular solute-binding protein [Chloroflexi bacterium]|nr:extracellular solute-binding protein [Chloroflexota bacterium]
MNSEITRREFLRWLGLSSAAAVLASCAPPVAPTVAPAPTTAAGAPTVAATAAPKAAEALTLPIVKEPLTLTYWVDLNTAVSATKKSLGEVGCYQEIEKKTGIHIDFQHPPANQATEQFNLVVASGKYPDILEHNWLSAPGGPAKYVKDGVILRLNNLIDQYAPNLKKILTEHPDWRKQVVTDEGDIFAFPFLRGDPFLVVFQGPIIRKDWLDKVGLPIPTTIDEWHNALVAFKTKDPNGNGKADEVPFTSFWVVNPYYRGAFESRAFIGAWGITTTFYQDKGVIKYGPLQPEYKEFLKTIAQWYKEGLMDPDFVAADRKLFDAKVTGNQLGAFIANTGNGIGSFTALMAPKDPNLKLAAAPYPVLKKGDKPILGQKDNEFTGVGAAITTACKRIPEAVKWLDYAYSDEGKMLFNFGIEGVSYKMENGYPKYTDYITKNPQKLPMNQAMAQFMRSNYNGPFVQDRRYFEQFSALPEQQDSVKVWGNAVNEKALPPITPSQDEAKKYASIMNDINTRYDETFPKIVTGALPVDAWDQFVKDIKSMGIDDAIKIQQGALDRYNKR